MLGSAAKPDNITTGGPISCSPVRVGNVLPSPPGSSMNSAVYGLDICVLAWFLGSQWP